MITLVPSLVSNNNKEIYIANIIRINEEDITEDYTRVYNRYYTIDKYILYIVTLVTQDNRELLHVGVVYDMNTAQFCVVARDTTIDSVKTVLDKTRDTINKHLDSAAVCYIRCIYPHRILEVILGIDTSLEHTPPRPAQAEEDSAPQLQCSSIIHTHKRACINACIVLLIAILFFLVGYVVGHTTSSPTGALRPISSPSVEDLLNRTK